jgi:outer membrane receptor protein involved in Fe transport
MLRPDPEGFDIPARVADNRKIMKKAALIRLFLGFIFVSGAYAVDIKGRVQSPAGKEIPEAVVLHRASGASAVTSADGSFSLSIEASPPIAVEVIHPDYFDGLFELSAKMLERPVTLILAPLIRQNEEVVVTALRYPEPANKIPAAETVLETTALQESRAPNIIEALNTLPGVTALGSGGFSLVPSIRGMARRRVLVLIDNSRIMSDRRTGPSASFISPEDIARIEVLRSPSSIFYGSDAIGGVVNIFTKEPPDDDGFRGRVHGGYDSVNAEKEYGLSLSGSKNGWGFYLSGQGLDAENYASPLGEVLQSSYAQKTLFGKLTYRSDRRDIDLSFLGARGADIGKPNRTSATKPTWYPRENQNLAQLGWTEKGFAGGDLSLHAYANPNFLETRTQTLSGTPSYVSKDAFSRTESTDFGVEAAFARKLSSDFRLTGGLDLYGRSAVGASNQELSYDGAGNLTKTFTETPYDRGAQRAFGAYVSGDFSGLRNLDLVGGLRYDRLFQSAHPGGGEAQESRDDAVTGFFAVSYRISRFLMAFANASSAYRTPGLNELFYTGITGRGFIIANPDLTPERSLNVDAGLKWIAPRLYAAVYGFRYEIEGLIDRYIVGPSLYAYQNVDRARLFGLELEAEYYPIPGWKVFGNFATLKGESAVTGTAVNDVPPMRLVLGSRVWVRRLSLEATGIFQSRKDNPGPAEIAIPASRLVNLRTSYAFRAVTVYVQANNLLNETYLARPDPEAMEEPRRGFVFGVSYTFE